MPGRKELRQVRIRRETTIGTPISPRFLWNGNGEMIDDQREVKHVEKQIGIWGGDDETYVPKYMAELELAETEASFEQLSDIFLMHGIGTSGGGNVAGSAQGASGSSCIFTLVVPTVLVPPTNSYTIEAGNGTLGNDGWTEVMEYTVAKETKLSFSGGEAVMISSTLMGRQGTPTNAMGTFTSEGTVPTVERILASKGTFYLSPVGSGFGTQKVTAGNILAGEITFTTRWTPKFPVDAGILVFATAVFTGIDIEGELTLEAQSSGTYGAWGSAGQVEKWRRETPQLLTMVWPGSTITEGTTQLNKLLQIGLPIKWDAFEPVDDQDGNDIRVGKFTSKYNPSTPAGGRGTIVIVRQGTSEFAGA
jgi:hypothetical protein